jgi:hypothetical protein
MLDEPVSISALRQEWESRLAEVPRAYKGAAPLCELLYGAFVPNVSSSQSKAFWWNSERAICSQWSPAPSASVK